MPMYDFDNFIGEVAKAMVRRTINRAHIHESMVVNGLQTSLVTSGSSDSPKKDTLVLQVRTCRSFSTGELVLAPAGALLTKKQKGKDDEAKSTLNPSQISTAVASVYSTSCTKKGRDLDEHVSAKWDMQTPLVVLSSGKSKKRAAEFISADCSKVPHYWAVLRAPSGTAGNMVFKNWLFED